jgi:hypothetical protein
VFVLCGEQHEDSLWVVLVCMENHNAAQQRHV